VLLHKIAGYRVQVSNMRDLRGIYIELRHEKAEKTEPDNHVRFAAHRVVGFFVGHAKGA